MNCLFKVEIPVHQPRKKVQNGIELLSEMNTFEHWTAAHKRHKKQKLRIAQEFMISKPKIIPPVHIKLTRIAPRQLDQDNLPPAFKYITDAICEYITPGLKPGRADSIPGIKISYHQEKGPPKTYALRIEIFQNSLDV